MQTQITTGDQLTYILRLERDANNNRYMVSFTSTSRRCPRVEEHPFEQYDDAFHCYAANVHAYNDIRLEPVDEETFLGLPKGYLYGSRTHQR